MGLNYFKVCGKVIGGKLEQNLSRLFGMLSFIMSGGENQFSSSILDSRF